MKKITQSNRFSRWFAIAVLGMASGCTRSPHRALTELADNFFEQLREERVEAAYALLAESGPPETSREQFEEVVRTAGLVGHRGVAWEPPVVDGNFGSIEGIVTTRDGAPLRIKVVVLRQGRVWEMITLTVQQPSMGTDGPDHPAAPDAREAAALVHASVRAFIESVQADNLAEFHKLFSANARKELTVEALRQAFDLFFELRKAGTDFAPLLGSVPEFDGVPALDENGALALLGVYPLPNPVKFKVSYVREADQWKLTGFSLSLSNLGEWFP